MTSRDSPMRFEKHGLTGPVGVCRAVAGCQDPRISREHRTEIALCVAGDDMIYSCQARVYHQARVYRQARVYHRRSGATEIKARAER